MDNHVRQNGLPPMKVSDNNNGGSCTNLIINYLPQTMSQDDIRSLFASIGEIESCKLIRDKNTGQSLGYGFVNYKNPDHAMKAIEMMNGLRLQNKTIKVSMARPSCDMIKGANLYVSGLSKTMTQRELENLFTSSGNIITSRILCDPQTGFSKGVGFVRFDLRSEAEAAIKQLNGTIPAGCTDPVTVKFANHPSSIPGIAPFPSVMASYLGPSRQLPGPGHYPAGGVGGRLRYGNLENPVSLPSAPGGILNGWCLFVYNLAPETEEHVLWQLFGPFGAVQNVKVMRDYATQKCKGFGFVTMTNYEDALLAITYLHGTQLGNRILQVSLKKGKNSSSGYHPNP